VPKLKTYETSLGFFDMAVAAPSMKAALAAWGSKTNLFHQGFAKETSEPSIVAATMAKPGVVLRRPVGSNGAFTEHAKLPKHLPLGETEPSEPGQALQEKQPSNRAISDDASRKAVLAYEREQKRREAVRRREEAAREKERERREKAIAQAEAALEAAIQVHDAKAQLIADERAALDLRSQAEDARWEKEKARLEAAVRRARE
jgi:hypothetical protein